MARPFTLPSLAAALFVTALAGCNSSPSPAEGEDVIIQFDRASLGSSAPLPISPTTEAVNGADTAIRGKLLSVTEDWVEIQTTSAVSSGVRHTIVWIPKEKILLIQKPDADK